ncbi:MAG: threonine synthase [Saprospiraceae bacterium]|nr:threonine synthase [Saprospiraceae bacterium]
MELYSTANPSSSYSLKEAVLTGLAPDGGLFMPHHIIPLPNSFWSDFYQKSFNQICIEVAQHLLHPAVPNQDIPTLIHRAFNFEAPLVQLDDQISVLELFHGPSLAFKDFGAQFMAQLMAYFHPKSEKPLVILVATSGDTGGAVAAGFHNVPGIQVVILFPKGKVSPLQQKQLTTFDNNVTAVEIDGSFDDCQTMVKKAFLDKDLKKSVNLSSANSINIARLIPQSFYFFSAVQQLNTQNDIVVSVPSGNFGNLTAGLLAQSLGLPIKHFVASTNINDVIPIYLRTGRFTARPSIQTLSNAMDVGNPSNFDRMQALYGSTWNHMKSDISGYSFTDKQTLSSIKYIHDQYEYIADPHAAVGFLGLQSYLRENPKARGIFLATAHHSKFKQTIDQALNFDTPVHPVLNRLKNLSESYISLPNSNTTLKHLLLDKFT